MSVPNPPPPDSEQPDKPDGKPDQSDQPEQPDPPDDDSTDDKQPSKLKNPKVRIGLAVAGTLVLVAIAIWFTWYWTTGRYRQTTDDAFLQADQVLVSSKIAGYVEQVLVQDNEQVSVGQPLARISGRDSTAAADQARAQLSQGEASVLQIDVQIRQQRTQVAAANAQLTGARTTLTNAQIQVDRYEPLTRLGAQTQEELTQMRQNRDQASAQLLTATAQRENAVRQIDTLRAQTAVARAQVAAAQAQLRKADFDVSDTLLISSIDGRVGNKTVQVGQYVQPTTRLMAIVPVQDLYLIANFKETQIGLMRVGQVASIVVDALGGETLQGTIESFAPGTGAQFALLPPQNSTGNYTKVVQRVPVRIHVDDEPEARKVLLPGLSVTVTIDTIGSKAAKKRVKAEASENKDARESTRQEAIRQDRTSSSAGPGR